MKRWITTGEYKLFCFVTAILLNLFFLIQPSFCDILVTPHINIDEAYDSNAFLSYDNKKSDHLTLFGTGVDFLINTGKTKTELSYNTEFSLYHKINELNNETHKTSFTGNYRLSSIINLNITDRLSIYKKELSDDINNLRSSFLTQRQKRTQNDIDSTIDLFPTGNMLFSFYYRHTYDDVEVKSEVDENHHTGGLKLNYTLGRAKKYTLFTDTGMTAYKFSYNQGAFGDNRDFITRSYTGGFGYTYKESTSVTAYGGASFNTYENLNIVDDNHFVFGGNIKKRFTPLTLNFSYSQRVNSSGGLGGAQVEKKYKTDIESRLTPKSKLFISGSMSQNSFLNNSDDSRNFFNRKDFTSWRISSTFRYNILYWLNFSAKHIYYLTNYEENTFRYFDYYYQKISVHVTVSARKKLDFTFSYTYQERFLIGENTRTAKGYTNTIGMVTISYKPQFAPY